MAGHHHVGADSNALTYFMESMWDSFDPNRDRTPPSRERAAMLLAYLYTGQCYTLLPTVEREYKAIRDQARLAAHDAVAGVLLLDVVNLLPVEALAERQANLERFHPKPNDCAILAEAELVGLSYLLSFDDDFVTRLGPHANCVRLVKPSEYWERLAIKPGSSPAIQPDRSNPLWQFDWWRV